MVSKTAEPFDGVKRASICAEIDCLIADPDATKLKDAPEDVGTVSEQFIAQHSRAESACGDCSLLLALSQHFIMWPLSACIGIPASTPLARPKSTNNNMNFLTTYIPTIGFGNGAVNQNISATLQYSANPPVPFELRFKKSSCLPLVTRRVRFSASV